MALRKTCAHARGLRGSARLRAWRGCGCSWTGDLHVAGVRRYIPLGCDYAAARAAHAQLVADRERGALRASGGGATFAAACERYLERLARRGARPSSMRTHRSRTRRLERYFGDVPLSRLPVSEIAVWLAGAERRMAPNTVRALHGALRAILAQAVAEGHLTAAPLAPEPPRRRPGRAGERLSLPEAERVMEHLPPEERGLAELVLLTGLRIGEALALTGADTEGHLLHVRRTLDTTTGAMGPPKTQASARTLALSPRALAICAERTGGPEERLFSVSYWRVATRMRAAFAAAGIPRGRRLWHEWRHLAASLHNEAGVSLRDSAAMLGHGADSAMTLRYGRASEGFDATRIDEARARHGASSGPGRSL